MHPFNYITIPCRWKTIHILKQNNPNLIGEALRHWSFIGRNNETGCYDTFKLPDFFIELKEGKEYNDIINIFGDIEENFRCYIFNHKGFKDEYLNIQPHKLIIAWQWDGDGTLYFKLEVENKIIEVINTDCKKDYSWNFIKNGEIQYE